MVEVDPRLFVTCRLCLDVEGHFQINPNVQQQIKYCFDIDVEPFDGLPQLICKKCENILREHYIIKKNFAEKQKELKLKLQNNATVHSTTSPTRLDDSDNSAYEKITRRKKKNKRKRIVNRLMSSSCDDSEPNDSSEAQINSNAKNYLHDNDVKSWDASLNKYYVCRICSEGFQDEKSITSHIRKHSILKTKYHSVFKTSCFVVMNKIDETPNMCKSNKVVVYSSDSILQNKHNPFYYIKYHPKNYSNILNKCDYIGRKYTSNSESTDCEMTTRKRRRRSSSETVVLNRHSEREDTSHVPKNDIIDCIDLGDSSDNGSYESNDKSNNVVNKGKVDPKTMHNIIKVCHNRFTKQLDSLEKKASQNYKGKEEFLQHKVLSIGRKVINNKGFNCTGLLRFLEYKDLSVIWKETNVLNANNDGKYVRIATRIRGNESNNTNNAGWKNYSLLTIDYDDTYNYTNLLKNLKTFTNFKKKPKGITELVKDEENNSNSIEHLPRISSVFSHTNLEITKTDSDYLMQKLLNKNPVSNPKQLPKKVNNNESYPKNIKVLTAANTVPFLVSNEVDTNNKEDTNTLPIVTSTVSLAQLDKEKAVPPDDSVPTGVTSNTHQPTFARIKVKPVSELMPEKKVANIIPIDTYPTTVQNTSQVSVVWPTQTWSGQPDSTVNVSNPHTWPNQNETFTEQPVWPNQNTTSNKQNDSVNSVSQCFKTKGSAKNYIVLDTVEFPNTKTTSPFQYLKNLLFLHNITLLDADKPLPAGSVSLVKLRLVCQQEQCSQITLCLTLFCFKNLFCIQITDLNLQDICINNIPTHWQWQLFKIYNNEVIAKVLQTAEKISADTFNYTKQFFALLKSIKLKNDDMT